MKARFWLMPLLCCANFSIAHEVSLATRRAEAAVIRLHYADQTPFAFEAYELYLPGEKQPMQVGRTNAAGEIIFLPQGKTTWALRAWSADGHGLTQNIEIQGGEAAQLKTVSPPPDRWPNVVLGLGVLLSVFGGLQCYIGRKRHATKD